MDHKQSPAYDNQSFDIQIVPPSCSRKRSLPTPTNEEDYVAKARKASSEAGLIHISVSPGCKIISPHELDKMKDSHSKRYLPMSCQFQNHVTTQGLHKKLHLLADAHERVAVRRLLESRINITEFDRRIKSEFPDLYCYNSIEILCACFSGIEYKKRWLFIEEDARGNRYLQHKQLTEETKANVKYRLAKSRNQIVNFKTQSIPALRHLTVYDTLVSVYGEDFYRLNNILKQCGPISGLAARVFDRYRYREKAHCSPAFHMITKNDFKLTDDQKCAVIGLLHKETDQQSIKKELARIFLESFSQHSTIDVLGVTFGNNRDACIVSKTNENDPYLETVTLGEAFKIGATIKEAEKKEEPENSEKKKKTKKKWYPKWHSHKRLKNTPKNQISGPGIVEQGISIGTTD